MIWRIMQISEGCYPPQPSASADNTLLDLHNSSYHTQPHPIIANYSACYTPYEVSFGIFLAQIAPSLHNKKHALQARLRLDFGKLTGPRHFQMPLLFIKNRPKIIYKILMLFLQSIFEPKWAQWVILVYRHILSNLAGLQLSLSTPWRPRPFKKRKRMPQQKLVNPVLPEPVSPPWMPPFCQFSSLWLV